MEREPVVDRTISEVGYDASCRTLEILFQSAAIYLYYFVPEEVHRGLMSANDHETYWTREIKRVYEHHRIADPYDAPRPRRRTRYGR
jgi:hypothetical protein